MIDGVAHTATARSALSTLPKCLMKVNSQAHAGIAAVVESGCQHGSRFGRITCLTAIGKRPGLSQNSGQVRYDDAVFGRETNDAPIE